MKIRCGFVTNSSSSSFVVAFRTIPQTAEEMRELLFGDQMQLCHYDDSFSTLEVAEVVLRDLKKQKKPMSLRQVCLEFGDGWLQDEREPHITDDKYMQYIDAKDGLAFRIYEADKAAFEKEFGRPEYDHFKVKAQDGKFDYDWKAYEEALGAWAARKAEKFWKELPEDVKLYRFHYSDNDGSFGAAMEHGGIFNRLIHKRISHH